MECGSEREQEFVNIDGPSLDGNALKEISISPMLDKNGVCKNEIDLKSSF